jgi:hypothetical protein
MLQVYERYDVGDVMPVRRHSDNGTAERLDEKLSTRIAPMVERRLRLYAAVHDLKIGEVVNQALDRQLPSLPELADELTRDACPAKNAAPGQPSTSKETH